MTTRPPFSPSAVDRLIHEPVRLGIMSVLARGFVADFTFLREALGVSDGNLASHLAQLADAGYITTLKEGMGRKSRTTYAATRVGKSAYERYSKVMTEFLQAPPPTAPDGQGGGSDHDETRK